MGLDTRVVRKADAVERAARAMTTRVAVATSAERERLVAVDRFRGTDAEIDEIEAAAMLHVTIESTCHWLLRALAAAGMGAEQARVMFELAPHGRKLMGILVPPAPPAAGKKPDPIRRRAPGFF